MSLRSAKESANLVSKKMLIGAFHRYQMKCKSVSKKSPRYSYHDKLMHMKYAISSFNVPSTQMAAATFVLEGHYHRHIRRMRQTYQRNLALYTCWIREYFPCEICITRPKGGFLLWIELPEQVDMVCVARQLCRMKIQVAAGSIFSASGKYRNCLRINCALPLSETYREALKQIGEAVYRAME